MLAATLRMATPIALAATGAALSERGGVINIGLEGMMLAGAFAGVLGSYLSGSPWLGVLLGAAAGTLFGVILAAFAIGLGADQVVSGVGLNILAMGLTAWLMQVIWRSRGTSPNVTGLPRWSVPGAADLPVVGPLLSDQSPLVFAALVLVPLCWLVLFRTPAGLRLRLVGEHPEAAGTLGLPVRRLQYVAVAASGTLAGLGGVALSLGELNWFSLNMSAGRGYMALAANIFGQWNPVGGFLAALLFAFTDALQMRVQTRAVAVPSELIQMLPYVLTVLVLAGAVIKSRPPAALGRQYRPG